MTNVNQNSLLLATNPSIYKNSMTWCNSRRMRPTWPPDGNIAKVVEIVEQKQREAEPTETDPTAKRFQKLSHLDTICEFKMNIEKVSNFNSDQSMMKAIEWMPRRNLVLMLPQPPHI